MIKLRHERMLILISFPPKTELSPEKKLPPPPRPPPEKSRTP